MGRWCRVRRKATEIAPNNMIILQAMKNARKNAKMTLELDLKCRKVPTGTKFSMVMKKFPQSDVT